MSQYTYKVPNISCGHCVAAVSKALNDISGVQQVTGDPLAKTITVDAKPPATGELIRTKLNEIGYPAVS